MRVALVSPYSWAYEGGVNRHVEALGRALGERHDVRILAPWDPPDRRTRFTHRAAPSRHEPPENLLPLGRTFSVSGNGSVTNLAWSATAMVNLRRALASEPFDVVHVHEPIAPFIGPHACSWQGAPVVGTFHAYSTNAFTNNLGNLGGIRRKLNRLHARIAVSEAAEWTGRRWFGGEYVVIPNGVNLAGPPQGPKPESESGELRVLFVGRPEERKGLPVLLRAFEALVEHVPARLEIVGADGEELARYLPDPDVASHVDALGRVSREELWARLHGADVLCAPSLAGESFGMILTEAFAAGTPVVASRIAGYSDVVTDGVDGVLVPPADAQALAEELQRLHYEPERRRQMGEEALRSAERFAWPRVAAQVEDVYEGAIESAAALERIPSTAERFARSHGLLPAAGGPRVPARRLPSLDPAPAGSSKNRKMRRIGLAVAAIAGAGLTAIAAQKIGFDRVLASVVRSDLSWVLVAVALMISSMFLRAGSWWSIARSAMPHVPFRRRDVTSATMIGVLMSATLPARLGEPARAMVLARRSGRMRETFTVLLGTLVSQSVLNIVALVMLGAIIVGSTDLFHSNTEKIFIASLAPLLLLVAVVLAPALVRRNGSGRVARIAGAIRGALVEVRSGLHVFRDPRHAPFAALAQLGAWAIQLLACFALLEAMGLEAAGIGAAAAVLFAVNVTAVIPATPSNIGVFQLAVVSVLTTGFGIGAADALAYGVILQAVEIATAVALGLPALVREGMTWTDMRVRALSAAPVRLAPRGTAAVD